MKKNFRNQVAFGLAAVLAVGSLAGCGDGKKDSTEAKTEAKTLLYATSSVIRLLWIPAYLTAL